MHTEGATIEAGARQQPQVRLKYKAWTPSGFPQPSNTCRGKTVRLPSPLGANNIRPVGAVHNQGRILPRIHNLTTEYFTKATFSQPITPATPSRRSAIAPPKGGHRGSAIPSSRERSILPILPHPQKTPYVETNIRSESAQQIHPLGILHYGHPARSPLTSTTRRLHGRIGP
mgnify:CR=1 FL=1